MARFTLPSGRVIDLAGSDIHRGLRSAYLGQQMRQYPGRAPGGAGPTGLLPNDARGWSQMLNEQREYAELAGGKPLGVEAYYPESTISPYRDVSTVGLGQTSAAFPGVLEGLQRAFQSSAGRAKSEAASELVRRFPNIYGSGRGTY